MALTQISTAGVKDDAVTSGKIPANAVGTSEIADTSVTLAKLEHGTSSNNGKFLRANNGADPTFETVSTDLVGDTTPQLGGTLDTNGQDILFNGAQNINWDSSAADLIFNDYAKLNLGTDKDFKAYQDTNNTILQSSNTLGGVYLQGALVQVGSETGEAGVKYIKDGAVELYHDNAKKLETWAGGIKLNGVENAGSQLQIGASNDLALEHDGSHSYIGNNTGELRIQSDTLHLTAKSGGEPYLKGFVNDRVELYYDNIKKAQTSNVGLIVANTTDNADYTTALTLTRRGYEVSNYGVRFQAKGGSAASQNGLRLKISDGSGSNYTSRFSFTHDGLLFNSDTAAANALDDYEEGTWTPSFVYWNGSAWVSVAFASGSNNQPLTTNAGIYTKIGNIVHVAYYSESFTITTGATGAAGIEGLPYQNSSTWTAYPISHANCFGNDAENGAVNASDYRLRFFTEDGTSNATWSSSMGFLMLSATYRTN